MFKKIFGLIIGVAIFAGVGTLVAPYTYIALALVAGIVGNFVLDVLIAICDIIKEKIKKRKEA